MDDKNREKLQQELNFLKESFDADVISKEEYEKGKERIEQKLKESNHADSNKENPDIEEPKAGAESEEKDTEEQDKLEKTEAKEAALEPEKEARNDPERFKKPKESKTLMYATVFVVLALVIFFAYSLVSAWKVPAINKPVQMAPACSTDSDCAKENANSVCINPGTENAKCETPQVAKTGVIVLNARKECFNCDTQRISSLIESWFGALDAREVDYSSKEGRAIADKYNVNLLPAYILEEKISNSSSFEQFRQIFIKKNNAYVLKDDAAGATFYFRRENMPNKLDLFVKENDAASIKAEKNLQEFLNNFKNVQYKKHVQGDNETFQLNIRSFPTFLINNQIKFSGVQTADTIKTNFCAVNKADECQKTLSKGLV